LKIGKNTCNELGRRGGEFVSRDAFYEGEGCASWGKKGKI